MNTRKLVSSGVVAALLAGATIATAGSDTGADRRAAASAKVAAKAIRNRDGSAAVPAAEAAVALMPQNAGYRLMLGEAYLAAGRFASAATAFSDALELDPANGKVALQLALSQIGSGDWGAARATLTANEAVIPAADRGLALALAGDPTTAIQVLSVAARADGANAKARQNLALSFALAGRGAEAKAVAAVDVSPADLDQRMLQWVAFAQPRSAADQVAALLGVTPVEDAGQPAQLALNATVPTMATAALPTQQVAAEVAVEPAAAEPTEVASAPVEAATPAATPVASGVVFGARREIVQAIPAIVPHRRAPAVRIAAAPAKVPGAAKMADAAPIASAKPPVRGDYYVQLGAYESAGVARDAWGRMTRAYTSLASQSPLGAMATVGGAQHYRLSVGGFARGDAVALCSSVRAKGGGCFVRRAAGEKIAGWSRQQVASR